MAITDQQWKNVPGGVECGKTGCAEKAVVVPLASRLHRIVACEAHKAELEEIKQMMRDNPNPAFPPLVTLSWRRDDRPEVHASRGY